MLTTGLPILLMVGLLVWMGRQAARSQAARGRAVGGSAAASRAPAANRRIRSRRRTPDGGARRCYDAPVRLAAMVTGVSVAAAAVFAQVDIARLGPQVGDKAINFSLVDQTGRTRTLQTVAGPRGTMLVFFRSADW